MEDLKTLIWAFTFSMFIAYFLIALFENIFNTWKSNRDLKANNAKLQRQLKEQQQKQVFLNSIKY